MIDNAHKEALGHTSKWAVRAKMGTDTDPAKTSATQTDLRKLLLGVLRDLHFWNTRNARRFPVTVITERAHRNTSSVLLGWKLRSEEKSGCEELFIADTFAASSKLN